MSMTTKKCSSCKRNKVLTDFGKNKTTKDGLQTSCKSCRSAYSKLWYSENQEIQKLRVGKVRTNVMREECRSLIISSKENVACADCKNMFPHYVMDFDHLEGYAKVKNISGWKGSLSDLQEEINKCEIVCSNCHRQRTHERLVARPNG